MTKEFEQYHGAVFSRLLHASSEPLYFKFYPTKSNSSYIINGMAGLYIKHSTKRASPWRFTFAKSHQDEIFEMYERFGEVFTAFVCHHDGIAVLKFEELKKILDENHDDVEWVSVARRRRTQYTVAGTDGKLNFKVSQKSCPEKILGYLKVKADKSEQSQNASVSPTVHYFPSG